MEKISIESGLFDGLRYEINEGLTAVINKMIETAAEDGNVSVKVDICLNTAADKDGAVIYKPAISWKVGTSVKLSESIKGVIETAGNEMVFDRDECSFALREYGKQESLFTD